MECLGTGIGMFDSDHADLDLVRKFPAASPSAREIDVPLPNSCSLIIPCRSS